MTVPGRKLRIVHCVGFYFPDSTGGTEVYVRDLVEALARHSIVSASLALPTYTHVDVLTTIWA